MSTPNPHDPGHPLRGLSMQYLSTTLISEVEATGKTRAARIYEIEPDVICGKGEASTCPRDGRPGAAYVDCVPNSQAGPSVVMLSYTWGYATGDIVDGLQEFCSTAGLKEADTHVWICCFCINQHRVREARQAGSIVPFEEFHQAFKSRVCGIGHICALMAPWQKPRYLTRVWCVFEIYTALTEGSKVTVTMPPEQSEDMLAALLKTDFGATALDDIFDAVAGVQVANAQASVEADRTSILHLIEHGPGFASIDKQVSEFLRDWVLAACESRLMQKRQAAVGPEADIAKLCLAFGEVLAQFNHFDRAKEVLEESRRIREAIGVLEAKNSLNNDSTRSCSGAIVLNYLGMTKLRTGDGKGARADMEYSHQIFQSNDALETVDGGLLMSHLGALEVEEEHFHKARMHFEEAVHVHTATNTLVSWQGALAFLNLGALELHHGRLPEAAQHFRKCEQIYEELGSLMRPNGAVCVNCLGTVLLQQGQLAEAKTKLELSICIRAATGTLDTTSGADCRQNLGMLKFSMGDSAGALVELQAAMQIYIHQKASKGDALALEKIFVNLAAVHLQAQDFAGLVKDYEEASETFMAIGTQHTHLTGALLNLVGVAKSNIGSFADAIVELTKAEEIYAACHMRETSDYAAVLINLAEARVKSNGDRAVARTELERAKGIFEALGQMSDPRAVCVLERLITLDMLDGRQALNSSGETLIVEQIRMICQELGVANTTVGLADLRAFFNSLSQHVTVEDLSTILRKMGQTPEGKVQFECFVEFVFSPKPALA